jgi:dUTP pyrophosphatase
MKTQLKVKKLRKDAVVPSYAKAGDAGMDLTCTHILKRAQDIEYCTGISLEIESGYVGLLFPRSSISNTGHSLRNSVGVIDSGYRGEIKLRMSFVAEGTKEYLVGEKIGQLVIMKIPEVEIEEVRNLSDSERSTGGFGSTGV